MTRTAESSHRAKPSAIQTAWTAQFALATLFLVSLLILGTLRAKGADATQIKRTAPPAWVERFTPDLANSASTKDGSADGDGLRYLIRDEQVHASEQTTFRHYALRYLSQDGVQEHSTLSFSFDPAYESLRLHQLVVHRDGKTTDRLPKQVIKILQREPNLEEQLYDGRSTATLILEDIRVGDVVEYAYSLRGQNPILAGHFVETFGAGWRDTLPQWRERLLWPASQPPPDIQNHGATCVPKVRPLDGGKTVEYRWEADNLPGKLAESETPSWTDAFGWVQVSDYTSWQVVARWSAKLFSQAAPDPRQPLPEELRHTVETIRALPDRQTQAVAALRYVQDNYRYLGIEIGANSHQPYPIATVCDRRFGDCKDKANLLSTLLRLLGFEADPALVETGYRHTIADWHPTPFAFDHAVVRLHLDGATYWLDPTREHQGGTLGHIYFPAYGKALVVNENTRELADVSPCGYEDTSSEITCAYQQEQYSGPTALTVHTTLHGSHADRTRAFFASTNREKIERDYLNFYARYHPKIRALAKVDFADDRDRNEILINERYEITDLWVQDSDPASKKANAFFHPTELKQCFDLPNARLRTMPFALTFPERITQSIRLHLPGKADIKPRHVEVKDPAFTFNYLSRVEPPQGTLSLTYQYAAVTNTVEAARMPEYLAHADQALDQLGYTLTIDNKLLAAHSPAATHEPSGAARKHPAPDTAGAATASAAGSGFSWIGLVLLPLAFVVVQLLRFMPSRAVTPPSGQDSPPPLPLHRCVVCGRTDLLHPDLDFRVALDGQDYCQEHSRSGAIQAGA